MLEVLQRKKVVTRERAISTRFSTEVVEGELVRSIADTTEGIENLINFLMGFHDDLPV